jgi:hypothetical protein
MFALGIRWSKWWSTHPSSLTQRKNPQVPIEYDSTWVQATIRFILKFHPDDVDWVGLRHFGFYSSSDAVLCPRKLYRDFNTWLFTSDMAMPQ